MAEKSNDEIKQVANIEKSLRMIADIVKQKGRLILTQFPITPPQFVALQWLYENGDMTIGDLSTKMYLACSTTTDLIDRMENNQLVERIKDQSDRRVVRIHLLEKGTMIIQEVIIKRQEYLSDVLLSYSCDDVNGLEQNLSILLREMNKEK
jgi:DNA-binding MarR family transcriptional regulator